MSEMKVLSDEELENVTGGEDLYDTVSCSHCNKTFTLDFAEYRKVGSGCGSYYEYKCPNCEEWSRY